MADFYVVYLRLMRVGRSLCCATVPIRGGCAPHYYGKQNLVYSEYNNKND